MAYVLNIFEIVAKVREVFVVEYCCHPGFAIEKLYFSGEGILVGAMILWRYSSETNHM